MKEIYRLLSASDPGFQGASEIKNINFEDPRRGDEMNDELKRLHQKGWRLSKNGSDWYGAKDGVVIKITGMVYGPRVEIEI